MLIIFFMLILFIPIPIYFKLNQQGLSIAWYHFPIKKREKEKTQRKHSRIKWKKFIKMRKINLVVGYQCEDIFTSMELYMLCLVVFPNVYAVLNDHHIKTSISIQYLPYQNSELKGMFTITLVKLILERLRRSLDESSD